MCNCGREVELKKKLGGIFLDRSETCLSTIEEMIAASDRGLGEGHEVYLVWGQALAKENL